MDSTSYMKGSTPWAASSSELDLLSILVSTPSMPNCSCRNHVDLFDAAVDGNRQEREAAQQVCAVVCSRCPAFDRCQQLAATMTPAERSRLGVVAGLLPEPKVKPAPAIPGPVRAADGSTTGGRVVGTQRRHREHQRRLIEAQRAARRAARLRSA